MKQMNRGIDSFFALLRGGLWERSVSLGAYGQLDYDELLRLGEEQSVLGLVTAGLEQVWDIPVEKKDVVPLLQRVIAVENRNSALNEFVASLFKRLQEAGIQAVLVKGQGIAQCYARPQWRAPGDVDLLLDDANYEKAKGFLSFVSQTVHEENPFDKHFSAELDGFDVELHGTMRGLLPKRADDMVDAVQADTFENKKIRNWELNGVSIPLPAPDDDVIFVFTHILKHFFHYGVGIRQICDWCRLLWTYQDSIDQGVLILRLRQMRLLSEWKVFAAFAVEYLGMPRDAMPFYSVAPRWSRKARRVKEYVLEVGNFGHNRDASYQQEKSLVARKATSFCRHLGDSLRHFFIFPLDSLRILCRLVATGLGARTRKVGENKA